MDEKHCTSNNPLCSTFVFLAGCILGSYFGHTAGIKHDLVVVGTATLVFHLTQVTPLRLFRKKIK